MINDRFLEECAKAFNGSSFILPSKFLVSTSTEVISAVITGTSFTGEIGTRANITSSVDENAVTYNFLRSGATVIKAGGDNLKTIALATATTGGDIMTALNISGLLQTTNFDVDFDWVVRFVRN